MGDIFDIVFLKDDIPITYMPSAQHSAFFRKIDETNVWYRRLFCSKFIAADFWLLGDGTIQYCKMSSLESLMHATNFSL